MKHAAYLINLLRFAFRNNPLLFVSIVLSIFSAGIELLAMSALLPLLQLISGNTASSGGIIAKGMHYFGLPENAESFIWAFVVLFAVRILTQLASQTLSTYLGRKVMAQLGSAAFEKIVQHIPIREIGEKSIGHFISMAGDEAFRASMLIISTTQFIAAGSLALLYYIAIARYSLGAAGFVLLFMVACAFALWSVLRTSHRLGGRQIEESRKAATVFIDTLNNLKAVKAFSAEKYVVAQYHSLIFKYTRTLFLVDEMSLLAKLVPVLILLLGFSIWLAVKPLALEHIGIAFIVTLIAYLMRFFPALGQGVSLLMRIASDAKAGKDVTEIIGHAGDTPAVGQPLTPVSAIQLRNLSFSYTGMSGDCVLQDTDFHFEKGKSYALVGRSGIGKSTLLDILLKFYSPTTGQVLLDTKPIEDIHELELRKRIVLVNQEAAIFDDTVFSNVCMGMKATLAEVKAACRAAGIHEVIEAMPDGYLTRLQYQGSNLSGGQRQRIAIARAMLRNPDVLILDESTSALDKSTQKEVIENILAAYADRIVIFVTHDPYIMHRVDVLVDLAKVNKAARHANAENRSINMGTTSALPDD